MLNILSLLHKPQCSNILVKKVLVLSTAQHKTTKILYVYGLYSSRLKLRVFSAHKPYHVNKLLVKA